MIEPQLEPRLTVSQAYSAMFEFLDRFFKAYQSDDVGGLLGGMSTLNDGRPMDNAYWDTWLQCVEKALANSIDTRLSLDTKTGTDSMS